MVSDTFGRSLSDEVSELETYQLLSEIYDRDGDMVVMPAADSHPIHFTTQIIELTTSSIEVSDF